MDLIVDQEKQLSNHLEREKMLESPQVGHVYPWVHTSLVEDVSAVSRFTQYEKEYEFRSDEAVARAGLGEHPSPMRYFLSGVAFCQQAWYAKASSLIDFPLAGLDIDVITYMDMRGEYKAGDVPANPQWLIQEVWIQGGGSAGLALEMTDEVNARCPVMVLVAKAIPVYERIHLNGDLIRDTLPEHMSIDDVRSRLMMK